MIEKDLINRKPYQYPVSLFGPRSLEKEFSAYDTINRFIQAQNSSSLSQLKYSDRKLASTSRHCVERQADLEGTASGYGEYYCPEGIPIETALFLLLAASGLAFGALFRAITLKTGGRRKKRSNWEAKNYFSMFDLISDLIWYGRLSKLSNIQHFIIPSISIKQ